MIQVKNPRMMYALNFPTTVGELREEMLEVVDCVKLPQHYCIVCLCYYTTLFNLCASATSKKGGQMLTVKPIMAKISEEDSETTHCYPGDIVIIDRSSLERGVHIELPFSISASKAAQYVTEDAQFSKDIIGNKTMVYDFVTQTWYIALNAPRIIVVEFKVVPVVSISASLPFEEFSTCNDTFVCHNPEKFEGIIDDDE